MPMVNVLEAKTNLSRLIDAVESGREAEVIIARNGKPAVRIVPIEPTQKVIIGLADGEFGYDEEADKRADEELGKIWRASGWM